MKRTLAVIALAGATACSGGGSSNAEVQSAATPAPPAQYDLGGPVDTARLAMQDIDIDPTGATLPPGSGTHATGVVVYAAKCAMCHGAKGEGVTAPVPAGPTPAPVGPKIVGRDPREGFPFGRDLKLVKTVGNYWPHSTTIFDYVRRAMPINAPGTLKPDEVYAVVAWILAENEIIAKDAVIDAKTLPAVKMPAAGRFVVDDRAGKTVR